MQQALKKSPVLLMVDDDREDIYLTKRAFCNHDNRIIFKSVQSGGGLFDYLNCREAYKENTAIDKPDIILLDINIPKQNGFEVLEQLRQEEQHNQIPVSILSTSNSARDIEKAYKHGASSFICKSPSAAGMKNIAEIFCSYWFNLVELPG